MTPPGVVLYGPPASGKDTITGALVDLDDTYVLFERLKVGGGRRTGYRPCDSDTLDRLAEEGLVVYANRRYGATYAIDRPGLDELFAQGRIPVVHMGQVAGLRAVRRYPASWLAVRLWCDRQVASQRLQARGAVDIEARLTAWNETRADLAVAGPDDFDLAVDTGTATPAEAAVTIHAHLPERPRTA